MDEQPTGGLELLELLRDIRDELRLARLGWQAQPGYHFTLQSPLHEAAASLREARRLEADRNERRRGLAATQGQADAASAEKQIAPGV